MSGTGEKKPPVGGVVDYKMLRHCNSVRGHLLVARERLEAAAFACHMAGLRDCGVEINRFVDQELDTLFRKALTLLGAEEASPVLPGESAGSPMDRSPSPQSPG